MKLFIKKQKIFYLFVSSLLFFSSCGDNKNADSKKQSERSSSNREHSCPSAELSNEQETKIKEMREAFRESNKELSREERQTAGKALQQKILELVPENEEQKMALSECFEHRRERGKQRGPRDKSESKE